MRSTTAWHYVHLHRFREIVLPVGREFKYLAKQEGFFKPMTTEETVDTYRGRLGRALIERRSWAGGVSSGVTSRTTYWVDRPDVAILVHEIPRRKMHVPSIDGQDIPPAPMSSIDATRCTRTKLDRADETEMGEIWCGDDVGARDISDVCAGETVFGKLLLPPRVF